MPDIRTLTLPGLPLNRIAEMLRPFTIAAQIARLHRLSPAVLALAATMPTPLSGVYVPGFVIPPHPSSSNEEQQ